MSIKKYVRFSSVSIVAMGDPFSRSFFWIVGILVASAPTIYIDPTS